VAEKEKKAKAEVKEKKAEAKKIEVKKEVVDEKV